jgi:hypothetical protein
MAAIYSNGGNRWNILGFNFTKRDALSSVYKISMVTMRYDASRLVASLGNSPTLMQRLEFTHYYAKLTGWVRHLGLEADH